MNEIVVGVDRSDTARRAAELAAEFAHALDTTLHIVMCVKPGQGVNLAVGSDQFHTDWVTDSLQFLDDMKRTLPHDKITRSALEGDPAKLMCEEARRLDARMIVVGNRRVQGAARVLGSIASDVAKQAPCDVYIANTTGTAAKHAGD
jgi:nucleotide-binding universal stress UspA family protein